MTNKNKLSEHDAKYLKETVTLIDMLTYPRPSSCMDDQVYREFLDRFIEPVFGEPDQFGNYIHIVKDETIEANPISGFPEELGITDQFPRTAYMAHHDTVHSQSTLDVAPFDDRIMYTPTRSIEELTEEKRAKWAGKPENFKPYISDTEKTRGVELFVRKANKIKVQEVTRFYEVVQEDNSSEKLIPMKDHTKTRETTIDDPREGNINCLGADCTSGIWLILEMIKAKVPGVYVIHNEEEIGRRGAEAIVKTHNETEKGKFSDYYWIGLVDVAISFDRKGTDEIITHQSGRTRCASDEYGKSLSDLLSPDLIEAGYKKLRNSDNGSFTDSYSYRRLIPECINLCVGYTSQHTSGEKQDIKFLTHLRDALVKHGHTMNDVNGPIKIERDETVEEKKPVYGTNNYGSHYANSYYSGGKNTQKKTTALTQSKTGVTTSKSSDTQNKKSQTSTSNVVTIYDNDRYGDYNYQQGFADFDALYDAFDDDGFVDMTCTLEMSTNPLFAIAERLSSTSSEKMTVPEEVAGMVILCEDYAKEISIFMREYGISLADLVEMLTNNN